MSAGARKAPRNPPWRSTWPLLPTVAFLGAFFLYPVIQLLWLSVIGPDRAFSLQHYAKLFSTPLYVQLLLSTFKVSFWTTVICLVAAYPVAYVLAAIPDRWRLSLLLWVLMPFWTSFLVRTFAWIVLLGRNGAINDILQRVGVIERPLELLFNFGSVMVGMSHALMPLAVVTMLSVMQNIDSNLMRAASTLGARRGQAFWRVYFPLSLPGIAASGLLIFITALGFFITPALLGGRREMMIAQEIIFQLEEQLNWGFAGAIAVMLLLATAVVFWLFDRVLGVSTLSGAAADEAREGRSAGLFGKVVDRIGTCIIAALGAACAAAGALYDRIVPSHSARRRRSLGQLALWSAAIAIVVFLALPTFFVIPVSFSKTQYIAWPPNGFTLHWYEEFWDSPVWRAAMLRSVGVGVMTAVLAMLIGVPAAFVLARRRLAARTLIMSFILSPLIFPHIIVGVALFYLYSRVGLVGTSLGLVLGHTIFAIPYVVVTVMAVLRHYDNRLDQAAASLGANRFRTLVWITLPLIRAGMVASFLFAFVKSFDELAVSLFIAGGLTTTLPKKMWSDAILQVSPTLTAVSSATLVFVTVAILAAELLSRRARRP
ncbi:MAG: ABC transporter permease subunit [Alphaproteobacteria bacterium]|nr:ABC transporter permease subunit [Alphaproteobacteria bacterium]